MSTADSACRPRTPAAELTVSDASLRIGKQTIWSNCSFHVSPGEFVAVLGPNGAGKSSLLKAIFGNLRLASGTKILKSIEPGEPVRIGYLPQRRHYNNAIRIRAYDVVEFGISGSRWGIPLPAFNAAQRMRRSAEREQVLHALSRVRAEHLAFRPMNELSGGEQQRVFIAQAIARHPGVLLLDEPFDSLDLPTQHTIAALLREIASASGMLVIMVAHDVNPILPHIDQAVILANGEVAAGSINEVITSETLSRLYNTPIEVLRTPADRLVVIGAPDTHTHHAHG